MSKIGKINITIPEKVKVAIVGNIVSGNNYYNECADFNSDGSVNVLDVVAIVSSIIN